MSGFRSQIPFLPHATPTKRIFCPEKSFVPSPSKIFDDYATMSSAPLAHISLPGSEPPDGVELIWKAISGSLGLNQSLVSPTELDAVHKCRNQIKIHTQVNFIFHTSFLHLYMNMLGVGSLGPNQSTRRWVFFIHKEIKIR